MTTQARCIGCGAAIAADAASCPYCGASATTAPAAAPVVADTKADRFRRLRESPSFESLRSFRPTSSGPTPGLIFRCVFGLVFAALPAVMIVIGLAAMSRVDGLPRLAYAVLLFPGVFVLVGVGIFCSAVVRWTRFARTPLVAVAAIVSGKRENVVAGKSSSRTEYYVTIDPESGARREYQAAGDVFGVVGDGDVGVAFVRDAYLLAFRTVDA